MRSAAEKVGAVDRSPSDNVVNAMSFRGRDNNDSWKSWMEGQRFRRFRNGRAEVVRGGKGCSSPFGGSLGRGCWLTTL
jgi:hypothetical protein